MSYEMIELKKLKLLERNPRRITKNQMEKLIEKLREKPEFLHKRPILVNVSNGVYQVYAGNQRVRAARKLKWKEIPCSLSYDLSEEQMKEEIILDNTHYGEHDYDLLANDYDIELLISCGFTEEQLQIEPPEIDKDNEGQVEEDESLKYCPHCNGIL